MAKFDTARLAPLASPLFTGDPRGVTAAPGDSDVSLATTAFVAAAVAAGGGGGGSASITVSDTPPASPAAGALWWESDSGRLYIYYNDGNTSQWVAVAAGSSLGTPIPAPQAGLLSFVSATQLAFKPFGGNRIRINGVDYSIPNAGIAGLSNTGILLNGNPGQNLAANTFYQVYASVDYTPGVVTAVFRNDAPGTHRPSQQAGNEGVEIMFLSPNEYNNHTLIGIVRTDASSQFVDTQQQRFVRTWFNRQAQRKDLISSAEITVTNYNSSASWAEVVTNRRVEWLSWQIEEMHLSWEGTAFHTASSNWWNCGIGIDQTTTASSGECLTFTITAGMRQGFVVAFDSAMNEGYHFAAPLMAVAVAGTGASWTTANNPSVGHARIHGKVG